MEVEVLFPKDRTILAAVFHVEVVPETDFFWVRRDNRMSLKGTASTGEPDRKNPGLLNIHGYHHCRSRQQTTVEIDLRLINRAKSEGRPVVSVTTDGAVRAGATPCNLWTNGLPVECHCRDLKASILPSSPSYQKLATRCSRECLRCDRPPVQQTRLEVVHCERNANDSELLRSFRSEPRINLLPSWRNSGCCSSLHPPRRRQTSIPTLPHEV